MGKTVRRKRKSRIKKRKTRVKKRRSRIKKRKAHFKRRRTRVKKRKFINKKTRRKKRRTIQKGGLGFKDLFMALSLLTASLSEASKSMLPRTQAMIGKLEPDAVVCSTRVSPAESSFSPKGLFRDLAPGLHPDKVGYNTDEEKSAAAVHMTAVNEIAGKLKNEQKKISEGTCSRLINIIGVDDMQKLTDAKTFIIEHHDKEKDDDNNELEEESDNDGNKSDDPETTGSNLPLIGVAAAGLGGLHAYGKYEDQKALAEEERLLLKNKEKREEARRRRLGFNEQNPWSQEKEDKVVGDLRQRQADPWYRGNVGTYYS